MAAPAVNQFELFAVLPEYQLVLCITPKVASMSIIRALCAHYQVEAQTPSHRYSVFRWFNLEQVQAVVPHWKRAMFVRDPLDRLRSVYDYHITKHNLQRSANLRERFHVKMSFRQFADRVIECPEWDSHFLPQAWMTDRVDFVGRFETLQDDWAAFTRWAELPLPRLAHVNRNRKSRGCQLSELSAWQRQQLEAIYAGDREAFGY